MRTPRRRWLDLVADGTNYTNAQTTFPSDSFPGMIAQLTGAGPGTTGVYYDDTYNQTLLPPGTLDCSTAAPGTEVAWTEARGSLAESDHARRRAEARRTAL